MRYLLLGAGGHAQEIFSVLCNNRLNFVGFIDTTRSCVGELFKYPIFPKIPDVYWKDPLCKIIVAVGNPVLKATLEEGVITKLAPAIIDQTTIIPPYSLIEEGVVIGAHCSMTIDVVIGQSTSINSNCIISHNCRIGKRCHISGGSTLSGCVVLEDEVYLGCGTKIIPHIHIGKGAIIGAGAVVIHDVAPYTIVAGCPAKVLRTYTRGEKVI